METNFRKFMRKWNEGEKDKKRGRRGRREERELKERREGEEERKRREGRKEGGSTKPKSKRIEDLNIKPDTLNLIEEKWEIAMNAQGKFS